MESVCIIDFAGNHREPGMWADWFPADKVVRFGGYWCDVPDMPAESEPTEEQCEAHAKQYDAVSKAGYTAYLEKAYEEDRKQRHADAAEYMKNLPRT